MTELTPEERKKIYEEEKAKEILGEEGLKKAKNAKGCCGIIVGILLLPVAIAAWPVTLICIIGYLIYRYQKKNPKQVQEKSSSSSRIWVLLIVGFFLILFTAIITTNEEKPKLTPEESAQLLAEQQERVANEIEQYGITGGERHKALLDLSEKIKKEAGKKLRNGINIEGSPKEGGYTISLALDTGLSWSLDTLKFGVRADATNIFYTAYKSGQPIKNVTVEFWGETTDSYGHSEVEKIYQVSLDNTVAQKINWDIEGNTAALMDILPRHWDARGKLDFMQ